MRTSSPAVPPRRESDLRAAFWDQVPTFPDGYKIRNCIQCGSCTGSCPVAHAMDITPRQIVALFRAGFLEEILRSRAIWICASCYACTVRCPEGIRVTDNLYALKRLAEQKGVFPKHCPSTRWPRRSWGTSAVRPQLGTRLGFKYFLSTSPALLSPHLRRSRCDADAAELGMLPTRIRRMHEVRAIIEPRRWEACDGYAYYPGCSLEATGRPYDLSLRRVFEAWASG